VKQFMIDIATGLTAFIIILITLFIILAPMFLGLYTQNLLFFAVYIIVPIYFLGNDINNNYE